MVSFTSNTQDEQQEFINNVTSGNQQNCIVQSGVTLTGNTVYVDNSKVKGDIIGISIGDKTDASCIMTSSMNYVIDNKLAAIARQKNEATNGLFSWISNNFQFNSFKARQTVTNNINNINQETCSAGLVTSTSGSLLYVRNTTVNGDVIGINSKTDSKASCSMTNMMKGSVYSQALIKGNQDNDIKDVFGVIMGIVLAIVALVAGVVVIGLLVRSKNSRGSNNDLLAGLASSVNDKLGKAPVTPATLNPLTINSLTSAISSALAPSVASK